MKMDNSEILRRINEGRLRFLDVEIILKMMHARTQLNPGDLFKVQSLIINTSRSN